MAIIPCRECAHQVSDQAASCPGCGAPISSTVKTKRRKRHVVSRILITLMTLWTVGTLLWLIVPSGVPDRLVLSAKSSLQRLTQGQHPNAATDQLARPAPVIPAPSQLVPVLRPVYRTTAEQLYQAYETNVVAIQTKIGASRVRLSGTVAEIDQDATGRPVVKLWTGKDTTAAMTLAEAQRTAAAQLVKGESVEIECDRIGHSEAALQGSGCTLAFVDVRTHEVNLALFLANENGTARVYVVGPMSEAACRAHSDDISSRLQKNARHEQLVWKNCTDAGRESIPPGGCRLNASAVSIPDIPSAHLWRYDCSASSSARTTAHKRKSAESQDTLVTMAVPATAAPTTESSAGTAPDDTQDSTAAAQPIPLPPAAEAKAVEAKAVEGKTLQGTPSNLRLASASSSDTGPVAAAPPVSAPEVTVAHAPQSHAEIPTPDDLARVRTVDPKAADHIAAYCARTTAVDNRDAIVADCQQTEAQAWTRLVLQNEFPTLDEATRKKCSEPPFPDTYLAKEACARYVLHTN